MAQCKYYGVKNGGGSAKGQCIKTSGHEGSHKFDTTPQKKSIEASKSRHPSNGLDWW